MKPPTLLAFARALIAVLTGGLSACSAAPRAAALPEGLPRFAMVEDGRVWRGGQPTEAGMDYLKSIGVQRIVKLNTARLAWEKREAEKRGMAVTCFPVSFFDQTLGHPDSGRFCAICDALHSKEKVYIHCTHGQDRTGLMVGFYRTRIQNMDRAAAFREMRHHGFHTSLLGLVWTWEHGSSPLEKAGSTGRPPG